MKKLLLLSFLICSLGHAQDYIPMLQEGNVWSVDVYYSVVGPPDSWTITPQISVGAMEIVNGIPYQRILKDESPSCLLREENGVLYIYDENTEQEYILIDMSLEVGDVFDLQTSGYANFHNNCTDISGPLYGEESLNVVQVEMLEIAGAIRKVISFEEYNDFVDLKWIEGIGNNSGFDMLYGILDIRDGSKLVCFAQNGENYFFNGATSCDNTTLGFEENLEEQIILYPNPVTTTSILQFPDNHSVDTIRIYNLAGRLVKEEIVTKDYYRIQMMDYRAGIYFYQVLSESKILKSNTFIIK